MRIEQIAAATEADQQDRKRKKSDNASHGNLLDRGGEFLSADIMEILPMHRVLCGEDLFRHDGYQTVTETVLMAACTWATISAGIESNL